MGLGELCAGCCLALARPIIREGDSDADRRRKRFVGPIFSFSNMICMVLFTYTGGFSGLYWIAQLGYLGSTIYNSLFYAAMRCCRGARLQQLIGVALVVNMFSVITQDWSNAALASPRFWGIAIILLDIALVCRVPSQAVTSILVILVLWLMVERVESAALFGLYDSSYWGPEEEPVEVCDCPDPPCAISAGRAAGNLIGQFWVIFADFYLTRGFATGMQRQVDLVTASVSVCTDVATLLSRYEVSTASELVEGAQGAALPPEMRTAFRALLQNLDTYRPCLPQSCLPTGTGAGDAREEADSGSGHSDSPPLSVRQASNLSAASATSASIRSVHSGSAASSGIATLVPAISALGPGRGALRAEPRLVQVALLCANRRGFLSAAALQQPGPLAEWAALSVGAFVDSVGKGVVDLVSGDHCFASFGASKPCLNRRVAAVRCAWSYARAVGSPQRHRASIAARAASERYLQDAQSCLPVSTAVVAGSAVCGDFGTTSLLRFMAVGGIHCMLQAADRLAAQWKTGILIDAHTNDDVAATFRCRLVTTAHYAKRGSPVPVDLWEAIEPTEDVMTEWMYAMEQGDVWKSYNAAMRLWLQTGVTEHTTAAVAAAVETENEAVAAAARELLARVDAASARGCVGPPQYIVVETGVQEWKESAMT
eukprot:TRINITY_DN8453_c0_g1_i1.p1 TRINITY_DN8453_c0_g1~~TRINITY_DN8453_c0_g1_i1.p1  ORF type:complete len:702 (+),score=143.08 TRINITY_DN8453_c0_g1_i1:139-2106(+)